MLNVGDTELSALFRQSMVATTLAATIETLQKWPRELHLIRLDSRGKLVPGEH